MTKEQEATKLYLELQAFGQQMQQLQEQLQQLEQQVESVNDTSQSLDELGTVKDGTEILVPVANGIFVKARITNANELLVNVGSHVNVPKSIPDVKRLMDQQNEEVRKLQGQLAEQLQGLAGQAQKKEHELHALMK
ncbi:prefoldin subunit alpha [Candidatus Woesearchaeota archaeon]|nr:prefoldin subunit alpha [Candidatus Woesearchaeota archaeon]